MSKTIQNQIDKSSMLLEGLRKNVSDVSNKGITETALNEMDATLKQLAVANNECDALRAELSQKVKHMNKVLSKAKEQFANLKRIIKSNYLQEEWSKYGVQDKR